MNNSNKNILYNLLVRFNLNKCYQCGNTIDKVEELSIEHKTPWLDSDTPKELFFNLENIAFSHLSCNCRARRSNTVLEVRFFPSQLIKIKVIWQWK